MNFKQKLTLAATTFASPLVLAHGEHQGEGVAGALAHQLTSPDHLAMLAVIGIALFLVLKPKRSARSQDDNEGR